MNFSCLSYFLGRFAGSLKVLSINNTKFDTTHPKSKIVRSELFLVYLIARLGRIVTDIVITCTMNGTIDGEVLK